MTIANFNPAGGHAKTLPSSIILKNKAAPTLTILMLSVLSLNTTHAALTATTAQTIQGTAPYLEFNGIKAIDTSSLLSIKIGADEYVSDASGNMLKVGSSTAFTTPILLPSAGDNFASVVTIVPADSTPKTLNNTSIIPLTSRIDDDGDGNFTITGNIQGVWTDKMGTPIAANASGESILTNSLDICNAPYTLTLSTIGSVSIATQYGDPNKTDYPNVVAKFTINPLAPPTICFAKPELQLGTGQYAGSPTVWNPTKGFLTQSATPATYNTNFPTTGANGLYFTLNVAGIDATTLTWTTNRAYTGVNDVDVTLTVVNANTVKVLLNGPEPSAADQSAVTVISPIPKPTLPARLEVMGTNGTDTLKYGFVIKDWFINRGSNYAPAAGGIGSHTNWCTSTVNYKIPAVMDLTNASGGAWPAPVQTPSGGNYYKRLIGGGLFSEWGIMTAYSALWNNYAYYTGDSIGVYNYYVASGSVNTPIYPSVSGSGICRSQ